MNNLIAFKPLQVKDFPLLVTWLNNEHVAKFWPHYTTWTLDEVQEKYATYVEGYKLVDGIRKSIHAYLIKINDKPIGYIQYFNVHDFPADLTGLPASCAGLDLFIGDPAYIGKKLSRPILQQFLATYIWPTYDACLVDPDTANLQAIKAFTNARFVVIKKTEKITWMIIHKP